MSLTSLRLENGKSHENEITTGVSWTKAIETFNNDLFSVGVSGRDGNFVMSGLSVHLALSMCSLGARESTAREMYNVLYSDKSSYLTDKNKLLGYIHAVKDVTLHIANKIYVDKKVVVKEAFTPYVKNIFQSDVEIVDFRSKSEITVFNINQWISKQTNNKITDILSPDDITRETKLIVLNAVYFKALWLNEFKKGQTTDKPFYISEIDTINVPTMHFNGNLEYMFLTWLKAECVAIPFKNPQFVLVIIKPIKIDGLARLEQNLEKIDLNHRHFDTYDVVLDLPKFKTTTTMDMSKYLEKMGMTEMFTDGANFEGIAGEPLKVDTILQKAFIEVDEEGVEAVAVTCEYSYEFTMKIKNYRPKRHVFDVYKSSRRLGCGANSMQRINFKVDRPFPYRIMNKLCNLTLFSGRVMRPKYN